MSDQSRTADGTLLVERRGRVATLVFNRPEQRNAFNAAMLERLRALLGELEQDGETRVVVLRGAGERAFSSGYDFAALQELQAQGVALSTPDDPFEQALAALRACPLPTIAVLRGFAVGGGGTLAAGCDLRVAGEGARLGMPPAKLGLAYSDAGLRPFLELIGVARTKYLFFSGRLIGAAEAYAIGLVDVLVADAEVDAAADALADELAANAPLSIRATKEVLARGSA
jgi:enoyl-CoA hydratase